MKRRFAIPSFIALISMALVGSIAGSLAWLSDKADVDIKGSRFGGSSDGAYFVYGDGSAEDDPLTPVQEGPYGIETARQLYNLAWLQYFGYFNKVENNTITPVYFELNADIDMTGWVLPPIGTTLYPFIGNFTGKTVVDHEEETGEPIYETHTVSNLVTSNDYNQILATNKIPGRVKQAGGISNVNIVGMFGVVGDYDIAATYDTSVTSIRDYILDTPTITSTATDTLIGAVAGYVDAPISNVAVVEPTLDLSHFADEEANKHTNYSSFTNISDYGTIGYCTNDCKDSIKRTESTLFNHTESTFDYIAQTEGEESGWGGSIDMKTTYDDLNTVWETYSSNPDGFYKYPTTKTVNIYVDGSKEETLGGYTQNSFDSGSGSYYGYEQKNANNQVTASYTFGHTKSASNFMYINGGKTRNGTTNGLTVTTTTEAEVPGTFYISFIDSNSVTHYMVNNSGTITDTTNKSDGSGWKIDNSNRLYNTVGNTNYYLYFNNGVLETTTTANNGSNWTKDNSNNGYYHTQDTYNYYITYDSGWTTRIPKDVTTYIFRNSNTYMRFGGKSYTEEGRYLAHVYKESSRANATEWVKDANNNYYPYGYPTNFILGWYSDNWACQAFSDTYAKYTYNNSRLSGTYNGYTYYAQLGNDASYWGAVRNNSAQATTITMETVAPVNNFPLLTPTYISKTTTTTRETPTYDTNPTYFPLRQENHNGVPKDTNTGYITCGPNDDYGNIRVSKYASSSLLGKTTSGSNVTLSTVYTVDGSTSAAQKREVTAAYASSHYEKYTDSKAAMEKVLSSNTSYIYGLHFMSASIQFGAGYSVYAQGAVINGNSDTDGVPYTNYELPINCIDFNLKEKGFVNFFAGTYFKGNNSFFSFYEVARNNDRSIRYVREISAIYKSTNSSYSYVYQYATTDTSHGLYQYSVPFKFVDGNKVQLDDSAYTPYSSTSTLASGYTKIFDCAWIEINNNINTVSNQYQGYAYYFEIPTNDGEYALGSVSGGTGAYLMYLDIGANAQKVNRTSILEKLQYIEQLMTIPKGIGVVTSGTTSFTNRNSYCITIKSEYVGDVTMARDSATSATVDATNMTNIQLVYRDESITVVDANSSPMTLVKTDVKRTTVEKLTYYDFATANSGTTKFVITKITVEDLVNETTNVTRTLETYKYNASTGAQETTTAILYDDDGYKVTDFNTIANAINTSSLTTTVHSFACTYPGVGIITIDFKNKVGQTVTDEATTYSVNGYDYTVTLTRNDGSSVNITTLCIVTATSNGYTFKINGTDANAIGTQVEISLTVGG